MILKCECDGNFVDGENLDLDYVDKFLDFF